MLKCEDCQKEFQTARGLDTHRGMAHKLGVGGKPRTKESVPPPTADVRQVVASGKVRDAAEVAGKVYGQIAAGFMAGMQEAMRPAKRAKKGSPEKVDNRE